MGVTNKIDLLALCGLAVLGTSAAGLLHFVPLPAALLLAFSALVWIPGHFLVPMCIRRSVHPAAQPALALIAGFSAASLLAAVVNAAGGDLSVLRGALELASAARMATSLRVRNGRPGWPVVRRTMALVVLYGTVLLAGLPGASSPGVDGDSYDHAGAILRIVESGHLDGGEALAELDGMRAPADPRKGTHHLVLAALCLETGGEPWRVWRMLSLLLFPCFAGAFVAYSRLFVRSRGSLAACCILFAVSFGGAGFRFASLVLYGQNLSVMWLWVLGAVLVGAFDGEGNAPDGMRLERWSRTLWVAGTVAGGSLMHVGVALHALVLAATLVAFGPLFGMNRLRALSTAGAIGLATVPAVLVRIAGDANWIHVHPQGVIRIGGMIAASPAEILRQHGMLFLGGLALLPLVAWTARTRQTAARQLAFAALPVLMSLFPPLATPLFAAGTYMVFRSILAIPVYPIIVEELGWWIQRARGRGVLQKLAVASAVTLWSLVFVSPTVRALSGGRAPADEATALSDVARVIRALPNRAVVVSDPQTSYALSSRVANPMVVTNGQHGNPRDLFPAERLAAVESVLSPWLGADVAVRACTRFDVTAIVVNGRTGPRAQDWLSRWDVRDYGRTIERLLALPGCFRVLYQHDRVTVLSFTAGGKKETNWGPGAGPAGRKDVPGGCVVASPDQSYRITGIRVEPARAAPGDTLRITVGYARDRHVAETLPDEIHIRFDHESLGRRCRVPGEKIWRRFRERSGRERRRFRVDRRPLGARFPRRAWPIGPPFSGSFRAVVPRGMQPGRYRVEVSTEAIPCIPNFSVSDFLCDHDHYSGTPCTTIELVSHGGGL